METERRIEESRGRALAWLEGMRLPGLSAGAWRFGPAHDPEAWPGMLLPAAYDAVHCETLLGGSLDAGACADWLSSFQEADGAFRLPGMAAEDTFKRDDPAYTREYIDFHATNYALGALRSLGERAVHPLGFMEPLLAREGLERWLGRRGWDDPWMEGNAFVNLGGFYLAVAEGSVLPAGTAGPGTAAGAAAKARLGELMDWLDAAQDPETGFWGEGLGSRRGLLAGMAGAMHSFHLYWRLGRKLAYADRAAEACLSLARGELDGVTSACLDVDIVDVLANLHRLGHRRAEIEVVLRKKLEDLLAFQDASGGFADEAPAQAGAEPRLLRFDGWVRGYSEPQGLPNCFATWFRCAAVGMADIVLHPDSARRWTFRSDVGIGYFPAAAKAGR